MKAFDKWFVEQLRELGEAPGIEEAFRAGMRAAGAIARAPLSKWDERWDESCCHQAVSEISAAILAEADKP